MSTSKLSVFDRSTKEPSKSDEGLSMNLERVKGYREALI